MSIACVEYYTSTRATRWWLRPSSTSSLYRVPRQRPPCVTQGGVQGVTLRRPGVHVGRGAPLRLQPLRDLVDRPALTAARTAIRTGLTQIVVKQIRGRLRHEVWIGVLQEQREIAIPLYSAAERARSLPPCLASRASLPLKHDACHNLSLALGVVCHGLRQDVRCLVISTADSGSSNQRLSSDQYGAPRVQAA